MNCPLYAYLGLRNGRLELCVSITELNPVGTRLQKGKLLPQSVTDFAEHDADPLAALSDMQEYLNDHSKPRKKR